MGAKLKWRLTLTYMLVVFIIVLVFELSFVMGVRTYYYGNIEELLRHGINSALEVYDTQLGEKTLEDKAKFLLENRLIPEYVDAQIIDINGNLLESSSRFGSEKSIDTTDFQEAVAGSMSMWHGNSAVTGESVMAVSAPIMKKHSVGGVIRFITSLEDVDNILVGYYFAGGIIGLIVIGFAFLISYFLATKVAEPVVHLKSVADKFAVGDFDKRATRFSDDELGELSDAFNYMAEEIRRADQIKNDFISSISHEIRTPLTSIMGWSETLLEGGDEEEQKMGLEIISKETERLTGLVEDLLDFSKLEANRVTIKPANFDIKALIDRTAGQFLQMAKKRKIEIKIESYAPRVVYKGDMQRIKQVLINVIDNAIKHGKYGGNINIRLRKTIEKLSDSHEDVNSIRIDIEDDGSGIAPEQRKSVTKMFFKGNDKKPGSGIGLAISKKIVELHGGDLLFDAGISCGTVVSIVLPLENKLKKEV